MNPRTNVFALGAAAVAAALVASLPPAFAQRWDGYDEDRGFDRFGDAYGGYAEEELIEDRFGARDRIYGVYEGYNPPGNYGGFDDEELIDDWYYDHYDIGDYGYDGTFLDTDDRWDAYGPAGYGRPDVGRLGVGLDGYDTPLATGGYTWGDNVGGGWRDVDDLDEDGFFEGRYGEGFYDDDDLYDREWAGRRGPFRPRLSDDDLGGADDPFDRRGPYYGYGFDRD